jgi:hypothetical protein
MPYALAIDVTLDGPLAAPRPKPRVGLQMSLSPVSRPPGSRTPWRPTAGSGVRALTGRERGL